MEPIVGFAKYDSYLQSVEVVFRCPSHACNRHFLSYYEGHRPPLPGARNHASLRYSFPGSPQIADFEAEIQAASPSFVSIYNQAKAAEVYGLADIAGTGYRKALEFLIKDYLIRIGGDDESVISRMDLSNCIHNKLKSDTMRQVAARAAWIGNDETHYYRKWDAETIEGLKELIGLTVGAIVMEVRLAKWRNRMPDGQQ